MNHKDNNGNTPLHDAIAHNHFKIVEILLEHEDIEIDVQERDYSMVTVFDILDVKCCI